VIASAGRDQAPARRWLPLLPIIALVALTLTLGRWRWWVVSYPIEGTLIALMLLMLLAARWRWLDHPVSRYLGTLSYSIYLYHMLAWYLAGQMVDHPVLNGVLGAMLTLALAWLSYTFIERPALRWRDRRVPAQRAPLSPHVAVEAR
jgi:peptidoglycan/LPS O-acetylase OafA/YrhL